MRADSKAVWGWLLVAVLLSFWAVTIVRGLVLPVLHRAFLVETSGVIVQSGFESVDLSQGIPAGMGSMVTKYIVAVRFEYQVDGRRRVSTRPFLFEGSPTVGRDTAEQYIAHYPAGKKVTVWYSRLSPGFAVLNRHFIPDQWVWRLISALAFLVVVFLLIRHHLRGD